MSEHTPGPFKLDGMVIVGTEPVHTNGRERNRLGFSSASYSEIVCEVYGSLELPYPKANAIFIVAACNSHESLVEALEKLVDQYIHMSDGRPETESCIVNARKALAEAKP